MCIGLLTSVIQQQLACLLLSLEHLDPCFYIFSIFSCCPPKVVMTHKAVDLAKSGYKTNKEVEYLGILLHVGKPLEPIC
jgi:hypothetical protein